MSHFHECIYHSRAFMLMYISKSTFHSRLKYFAYQQLNPNETALTRYNIVYKTCHFTVVFQQNFSRSSIDHSIQNITPKCVDATAGIKASPGWESFPKINIPPSTSASPLFQAQQQFRELSAIVCHQLHPSLLSKSGRSFQLM